MIPAHTQEISIIECAELHSAYASEHHLNHCPKNAALQKASQVNEATAALCWQNCSEVLNVTLSIYLCPPDKSKALRKYHIPLVLAAFDMHENAEEMLKQLLMKASQVWREASGKNVTVMPSFERDDVTFAVACSATEHYHLEQAFTTGSMVSQMNAKIVTTRTMLKDSEFPDTDDEEITYNKQLWVVLLLHQKQASEILIGVVSAVAQAIVLATQKDEVILYHMSILSGKGWVKELLNGHPKRIHMELGTHRFIFNILITELQAAGYTHLKHVKIEEQLAIFLYICVMGLTIRHIAEWFQ
ncbi:hypothetical protein EDD17DRAFT_1751199 [Pisolithus thermaeus]|nr:hypothetical protein EDD17DRAFT_1751199 [Pisolithus thermaeus]